MWKLLNIIDLGAGLYILTKFDVFYGLLLLFIAKTIVYVAMLCPSTFKRVSIVSLLTFLDFFSLIIFLSPDIGIFIVGKHILASYLVIKGFLLMF